MAFGFAKKPDLREFSFESKELSRTATYRILLPSDYDSRKSKKTRYPVLYLLHGLSGSRVDWYDRTPLAKLQERQRFVIVMPDGGNGWYTNSATKPLDKYESFFFEELMPSVKQNFRIADGRDSTYIAGLSMGGFGSMKFALLHPDLFVLAGSFSGALKAPQTDPAQKVEWQLLADSNRDAFGAMGSITREKNNIYKMVESLDPQKNAELPFFYIDCGTEDSRLGQSSDFANLLLERKIPHEFRQLPGRHDWNYWGKQIGEFLRIASRMEDARNNARDEVPKQ